MAEHRRSQPARLLVLGAGAAQVGLLEAAAARDLTVIAVDRDPLAAGFAFADERAVISSEDEQGIERLARARAVDGLISPGADWTVGIAARVAERLGVPHPIDAATAALATTKTRQRERFALAGVLQPQTFSKNDPEIPFPCVVKAPDRQGQRGLTLVHEREAFAVAVETAAAESRGGGVLVEELIDGPELTVNAVSVDGTFIPLTVTDRLLAESPAFGVALAHAWPSVHSTQSVIEAARAAVSALGIENGPSYTQVRLGDDGRAYVVEVAARLGGGHDAELCRVALDVDLNDLAISFALGDLCGKVSQDERVGGACVVFLVAPEGVLRAVEGVDAAERAEGVEWVRTYRQPGWRFGPLRRGADRAGAILATGTDRDDALARARRAAEAVRFLVDAAPA
ncbi:MAG: ATP-grasp domain-containing protein [Thermoleophilia bacterium]